MLEKPSLPDKTIAACLESDYGLTVSRIAFLPLGADRNTAVYRAEANDGTPYFVKLRQDDFNEASVTVPRFLRILGLAQIIAAVPTQTGQLWTHIDRYTVILYPYVEGKNGFEVALSDQQRVDLGRALKRFHTAAIPEAITRSIRRETFSPRWRDMVRSFLMQIEQQTFDDPVAVELAGFLNAKSVDTRDLVNRAERLVLDLQAQALEYVLCHGDIHGWNLLIGIDGALYMVDWDTLVFAPRERDLMFVGSGLGGSGHTLQEEINLFYQGYGHSDVNVSALAYYRYERIIEDIAVTCEQILLSDDGGADRRQGLNALISNFRPGGTIEIAYAADVAGAV